MEKSTSPCFIIALYIIRKLRDKASRIDLYQAYNPAQSLKTVKIYVKKDSIAKTLS